MLTLYLSHEFIKQGQTVSLSSVPLFTLNQPSLLLQAAPNQDSSPLSKPKWDTSKQD